ncbi:HEAT repeat domain-containing protein [Microlunatus speluncae]|uniref:HEAT repeat domain-containing protein n=1 Tax=Microlunatus speluncae TaxID=2594267 RepID=UPI0012660EDA|nr:HEAT repeat domain-containing protein [Microlunatus speluncae]
MERDRGTPAEQVGLAVQRWGADWVIRVCAETLALDPDSVADGDPLRLAAMLTGRTELDDAAIEETRAWLAGGKPPGHRYWARVWACRALLYVWHDSTGPAVAAALADDHWRVRELAGKVITKREIPDTADTLATLINNDPVPRVRAAACRALAVVGEGEHLRALAAATDDHESLVVIAADRALDRLQDRLDRRTGG